jgi:hypothetical protein
MPLQSSLIHLGLAKETTQGTPVAPTVWIPVDNNVKAQDDIKWIEDKGVRGAPVSPVNLYQGPMSSSFQADAMFYPDVTAHWIMALLGMDTVTGSVSPYTHTFTLAQSQPPSYTLSFFNGYNERQYPGSMIEELGLKWAIDGALMASSKWVGWPSVVGTTSTPAFGTVNPFLAWEASLMIGGSVNPRLIGFDWSGKRKGSTQWAANNTQKPAFTFVGPLEVSGKLTFAIQDDTELLYMLNNTQPSVVLTLTAPNSGPTLKIQMSKCAFTKPGPSFSKDFVEYDFDIQALPNTTDAGSGSPISPVQFVLTNAQSTAY